MSVLLARALLVVAAYAAGVYGALLLWGVLIDDPTSVVGWLAGGVVLHDFVLAPTVLLLGFGAKLVLPPSWQLPAAVGLVIWGSITLLAVPVLGRFGARADDPTLLDRPYLMSWLGLSVGVLLLVGTAGWIRSRRSRRQG